jgi:hypothetical protein
MSYPQQDTNYMVSYYNHLTPDGDSLNECLLPAFVKDDMQDYTFMVYNRWGDIVFETHDPTFCWHGNSNVIKKTTDGQIIDKTKEILKTDVYICLFKFKDPVDGSEQKHHTHITLLREPNRYLQNQFVLLFQCIAYFYSL